MADWFKFYENDLDETRFQYAVSKLSEITPVWVGILSECCRHKSDTIRWGADAIELFGFSRRLNVSIPKVNEAINLLVEIGYIQAENNTLKVLNWNKMQSEYCQRLQKRSPDSVPTVSRHSADSVGLEERRGEESRRDKKRSTHVPPSSEHGAFIHGWCENFKAKWKVDYNVVGSRDGKAVKLLLSMGILRIDLLEIAKKAWESDSWECRQGRTIYGFQSRFNQIKLEVLNGNTNNRPRRENPRNFGVTNDIEAQKRAIADKMSRINAERDARYTASEAALATEVAPIGHPSSGSSESR